MGHCFIMTHRIHKEGDLQIYFGVIFHKTRHHAQALSHLARLYTVPFLWPREEHIRQPSWLDNFAGQFWLWRISSRTTFVAAAFDHPTNLRVGQSWPFPASSIKFLTRRILKSQWVYLAPPSDNSIQLLITLRSRRWKNNFMVHLKVRRLIE